MKIVHIAAEHADYLHTGGLGEVVRGLSRAQAAAGHDVTVLLPGYRQALARLDDDGEDLPPVALRMPWGTLEIRPVYVVRHGVRVVFLREPALFDRSGPYGDASGPWSDNPVRFSAFARAAAQLAAHAEIAHLHDFHAGLAAPHLLGVGGGAGRPKVVMTVHNLAFQGDFPVEGLGLTGLSKAFLRWDGIAHNGRINPMKAGLQYSDLLTTVSPTYAKELTTPEGGWDLAGLFAHRRDRLVGIVNGLDAAPLDAAALAGRSARRSVLCSEFGISEPAGPLFGMISRLTPQKGVDLWIDALPAALERGAGGLVLGTGDRELAARLSALAERYAGRFAFIEAFNGGLADRIYRGADAICVPSRFEPCGLVQLHAMRAGALPVVRRTGGLADTVRDVAEGGWGIVFDDATAEALADALGRAIALYNDTARWRRAVSAGLEQPLGWAAPAQSYLSHYSELLGRRVALPVASGGR